MPVSKRDTSEGFRPKVRLSEDIVRPANDILRLDGLIETKLLSSQLHQSILGMTRLRNAVSSLRMEGEVVELDRARMVLDGTVQSASAAEEGFLRLARAYSNLSHGSLPEISVDGVVRKHKELFGGILGSDVAGELKNKQNYIVTGVGETVRFIPTPPERVLPELHALFDWYHSNRFGFPPVISAALFFAEFQAIHPFVDGNGRLGRYLNVAVLLDLGCLRASVIPLDLCFFRSSEHYYDMLGTTNTGIDYNLWCRYFVGEVRKAYRIAVRQANLSPVVSRFSRESTRSILRWVLSGDGNWFSRSDYPNKRRYSNPTLWSSLDELVQGGILEARGERRGRLYRLRSQFLAEIYRQKFGDR